MALPTQTFDYFNNRGGMNAVSSEAQLKDDEMSYLLNVVLSSSGSLKKRAGIIKYGDKISSSAIIGLDRYKTVSKSTLLAFSAKKAYYYAGDNDVISDSLKVSIMATATNKITFTANLSSDVEVGQYVTVTGSSNDGRFAIVTKGTDYVTVASIASAYAHTPGAVYPQACIHDTDLPVVIIDLAVGFATFVASTYDSVEGTIDITLDGTQPFIVGDVLELTIGSDALALVVETVVSTTRLTVNGAYEDFQTTLSPAGTEVVYGTRIGVVAETDWDGDGTDEEHWAFPTTSTASIDAEDVLSARTYARWWRCTTVAATTTYLDEQLSLAHGTALAVKGRWTVFTSTNSTAPKEALFDTESTIADLGEVYSISLNDNMYTFNGLDESFRYDGTKLYRAGFHEVPSIIENPRAIPYYSTLSSSEGSGWKWKYTYQYTDSNGRLYESGASYKSSTISVGETVTGFTVSAISTANRTFTYTAPTDWITAGVVQKHIYPGDRITVASSTDSDGNYTVRKVDYTNKIISVLETITGSTVDGAHTHTPSTSMVVPVWDIPARTDTSSLGYDVSNVDLNLYRTTDDATTYNLTQQVSTARLGNYLAGDFTLSNFAITITDIDCDTIGEVVLTVDGISGDEELDTVQDGAFVTIANATNAENKGTFRVTDVDDVALTITLDNPKRTAVDGLDENAVTLGEVVNLTKIECLNTPDLSGLEVGDYVHIKGTNSELLDGVFVLCRVEDASDEIYISNPLGADSLVANGKTQGHLAICVLDNSSDALISENSELYTNNNVQENNDQIPVAKYCTSWNNRLWAGNGRTYQYAIWQNLILDNVTDGDMVYLYNGTDTEIYEFDSDDTINTTNAIKVDIAGASTEVDVAVALAEAINAKNDGMCWAHWESIYRSGAVLLRERERNGTSLQLKTVLTTDGKLSNYKINDGSIVDDTYYNFSITYKQSRVWYSKDDEPEAFVGAFDDVQGGFYLDISPNDGQEITGIIPLKNNLIVFKEDSCYRVFSVGGDSYDFEKIDSSEGCIAPKSICMVNNKIMFLSRNGVYATDGFYVEPIGEKMDKEFNKIDKDNKSKACAVNYLTDREYRLTVPYAISDDAVEANNYTFCLNYDNAFWSLFNATAFTRYVKLNNSTYVANVSGEVFKLRDFGNKYDFRDDFDAITSTLYTKWYDLGSPSERKFFYKFIMHVYQSGVESSTDMGYAYDFSDSFEDLGTFSLALSEWGHFSWAHALWGFKKSIPVRKSPSPKKSNYARFSFENTAKDEALEILGWSIEAKMLNSQAVRQT